MNLGQMTYKEILHSLSIKNTYDYVLRRYSLEVYHKGPQTLDFLKHFDQKFK